jgi:5'-nucleotidase
VHRMPVVLLLIAAVLMGVAPAAGAAGDAVPVQVLAINDLHGRIALTEADESRLVVGPGPDGAFGKNGGTESDDVVERVGGVMNLATVVQGLQRDFRRQAGGSAASFLVGAGDLIGASPPMSGDYRDEPTIEALNALGMDVAVAGDDEFARGTTELRRISAATDGQNTDDVTSCQGVTPGVDGCFGQAEHAFTGASYPYLAANVLSRRTGRPMLPPYQVFFTPVGVKVALIGVVIEKPKHVPPEGVTDVQFVDEADAVNRWVPELQDQGVEAIGVLLHEGGQLTGPGAADPNGCDGLSGPVVDINNRTNPAVDFMVTGHTHAAYICTLPVPGAQQRLVTQAGSYGRLVTDIRLTVDRGTGDVDRAATYSAVNVPVERKDPDPGLQAIVDYWAAGPANQPAPEGGGALDTSATTDATSGSRSSILGIAILISIGALALVPVALAVRRRLFGS